MSGSGRAQQSNGELIRQVREEEAGDHEPLNSEERTVTEVNKSSLYVNVTAYAKQTLKMQEGDSVMVHTFRDHVRIEPAEGGDGL